MTYASNDIMTATRESRAGWRLNSIIRGSTISELPGLISITSLACSPMAMALRRTSTRRGGRAPCLSGMRMISESVRSFTTVLDSFTSDKRARRLKSSS